MTFDPASPDSPAPTTIDAPSIIFNVLESVVCPSATQCTAVDNRGQQVTFNPTAPGTPTSTSIDAPDFLQSVACPSLSECTAVDNKGQEVTFNPTAPGTPAVTATGGAALASVVCPSVSQCTAVDSKGQEVTFSPTSGRVLATTMIDSTALNSVACPSVSECTAVDNKGHELTFNPTSPSTTVPVSYPASSSSSTSGTGQSSVFASHASLSGVASGRAKLSLTLTAAKNTAALRTITIALPSGLGFSSTKKNLSAGVHVRARARTLKFSAKVSRGKLTITLKAPVASVQLTISSPAITVARTLAKRVKSRKVKTLSVLVTATNTSHVVARIALKLKAK